MKRNKYDLFYNATKMNNLRSSPCHKTWILTMLGSPALKACQAPPVICARLPPQFQNGGPSR